ncbi:SEC-C metal-binding domain-containing protein [Mesobacillus selenatarsenatis]|uniref:SEC-C motif domain protein n=1 Tax=Mesobacillus selenatarsenatis (strain DSM 18680 / JCM 14380 / FERM P-15431 / SF-1) TaxID=1321606 RepID=A0A0A8WYT1_MESS1|nr:SEC-C metal-binding domain-containing protein [Mesobacillus selenatarsenatis]GAM12865.1 SEC-C motif domain protein [Mesobacillus selenatarsenatis SF-1]
MNFEEINNYLQNFTGTELRKDIPDLLSHLKKEALDNSDQDLAKNIWCLEQVYIVIAHYLNAFRHLHEKDFFEAWCQLDRAEIELSFLRRHFDYSGNKYNLGIIENHVLQLQKMFPYQYFFSRESVVKKWYCSICNEEISLRKSCGHKVGEIYNGEQCCRVAGDIEFLGIALVTDPFDKYTVIFPKGLDYNYSMLESLMVNFKDPFQIWELSITKKLKVEYEGAGKNRPCICNSGKKYKMCCLKSGNDLYDHYHINFFVDAPTTIIPVSEQFVHTWK